MCVHRYRFQAPALIERAIADVGDAAGNGDASQTRGCVERTDAYRRDGVGNRDAAQAGVLEHIISNAGDRQAGDGGWNRHVEDRPGVAGDGDGVVGIGRPGELRLRQRRGQ